MHSNWIVKLKNTFNGMKLVAYEDGRVYVDGTGPLIGKLSSTSKKKVKFYVNEYAHYIKRFGYEILDRRGYIASFWDSSNKKRDTLSVKGWPYELEFLQVVFNRNSYRKFFLQDGELRLIFDKFLEPEPVADENSGGQD